MPANLGEGCALERVLDPRIVPLEVWDLPLDGEPSWRRIGTRAAESMREAGGPETAVAEELARRAVRLAEGIRRGETRRTHAATAFDALFLAGGLTEIDGFREAAASVPAAFPVLILPGGRFGPLAGARNIPGPGARGPGGFLAVDVGQTGIKASAANRAPEGGRYFPRPLREVPVVLVEDAGGIGPGEADRLAAASVEWVASSIAAASSIPSVDRPEVVLALPCGLGADLKPGPCTYAGWRDRADLVSRIARTAIREASRGRMEIPAASAPSIGWRVLNDAELAGFAALAEMERLGLEGKTLVLTLGFGPGAAIVARDVSEIL